jgi:hypothetical protein
MIGETWTCHVCKEERPDRFISVFKRAGMLADRFPITENVRYCNDREDCRRRAPEVHFLPQKDAGS